MENVSKVCLGENRSCAEGADAASELFPGKGVEGRDKRKTRVDLNGHRRSPGKKGGKDLRRPCVDYPGISEGNWGRTPNSGELNGPRDTGELKGNKKKTEMQKIPFEKEGGKKGNSRTGSPI